MVGFFSKILRKKSAKQPQFSLSGPSRVKVGWPSGTDGGILDRAIWNHFGTSRNGEPHIPPRPALRIAIDKHAGKYKAGMATMAVPILTGRLSTTEALGRLGIESAQDIKQEIVDLQTPPNAPSTIAQKGSSNPLIDTGNMKEAVHWKLEDG